MVKLEKIITYFSKTGAENTKDVVDSVMKRLQEGDVKTVVVASTSGETGVKFAKGLKDVTRVIAVSHEKMRPEFKTEITRLGGIAADETYLPLHAKNTEMMRNAFYALGQGYKVAIEVILIAAETALIKSYVDVIGVGGTGGGSDTAILARSTTAREIFSEDPEKKLEVREIIAMPLTKKWW